jgi:hypothetical protein
LGCEVKFGDKNEFLNFMAVAAEGIYAHSKEALAIPKILATSCSSDQTFLFLERIESIGMQKSLKHSNLNASR